MVREKETEYRYTVADEAQLDALLSGHEPSHGVPLANVSQLPPPKPGFTVVIWSCADGSNGVVRPFVLVSQEADVRRLCGRYAQLRGDLSPLTTWCHLLTPDFLSPLDTLVREPDLGGMEAAWVGLVVAEAVLLVEKPLAGVRIPACLATQSFAVARASSLWRIPIEEVLRRFDAANRLFRNEKAGQREDSRVTRLRSSFRPMWAALVGCIAPELSMRSELRGVITALKDLQRARWENYEQEASVLARSLLDVVPEAGDFARLSELTPELRLRLFDKLVECMAAVGERSVQRHTSLAVLAGYLATVAAGGAPSLALAENLAGRFPEILAWAYLIGGIGERVVWTSSFDGLGRLVVRELSRPLRLNEPPVCDFALEEVAVLADTALADPLVHLKIKQSRLVNVALCPGTNVSIPTADPSPGGASRADANRPRTGSDVAVRDTTGGLADALWPRLRAYLDDYLRSESARQGGKQQRGRGKRRSGEQTQLPLPGEPKK